MSNQPRRRGPMGGGHGRMGTARRQKDFKGTMKKLFTYLSEYKIGIFFVMIFANRKYGFQYYWTKGSRKSDDRNFQRSGRKSIWRQRN